ncbi:MAG: hypothetical protein KDE53_27785 [Caldilineaceae bacterium]|nr:hypothetical protein [Caldilineaceae bacterium]
MELPQLTAPMGWLLADLLVGAIIYLTYPFIPVAYRLSVRNIRWILVPYLALLQGGISPRLMGLTGINWLTSFGLGLGLVVTVAGFLVLVRSTTDFTAPEALTPTAGAQDSTRSLSGPAQRQLTLAPLFFAGAEEFHWSFLRGALWESQYGIANLLDQPAYWAIWLAALLAVPAVFRFHTTTLSRLFKLILLLLTTILFIYTQNFWLCWMLHSLVLLLLIP